MGVPVFSKNLEDQQVKKKLFSKSTMINKDMALHCFKVVSDILNRLLLAKQKKRKHGWRDLKKFETDCNFGF